MILKPKWCCMRNAQIKVCGCMKKLRFEVSDCTKYVQFEVRMHEKGVAQKHYLEEQGQASDCAFYHAFFIQQQLEPQFFHVVKSFELQLSHAVTYLEPSISHETPIWLQNQANIIFDTHFHNLKMAGGKIYDFLFKRILK